jgi:hypothetical protein
MRSFIIKDLIHGVSDNGSYIISDRLDTVQRDEGVVPVSDLARSHHGNVFLYVKWVSRGTIPASI